MAWQRKSKFHAKRTEVDGIWFHSKKEAKRYTELKLLERVGEIKNLELQPRYKILVHGHHICDYIADFRYKQGAFIVVEDVKGVKTPVYQIKKKLMKAVLAITILET